MMVIRSCMFHYDQADHESDIGVIMIGFSTIVVKRLFTRFILNVQVSCLSICAFDILAPSWVVGVDFEIRQHPLIIVIYNCNVDSIKSGKD